MEHFITSNFNLLHTNSIWNKLNKFALIDDNYDNHFLAINNPSIRKKFKYIHNILYLDNTNYQSQIKKIQQVSKLKIKNLIFFYIFYNLPNQKKINKTAEYIKQKLRDKDKIIFTNFLNFKNKFFDRRNLLTLKNPLKINYFEIIIKKIFENIKSTQIKPYKLIILDCDNTLWGGVLDEAKKEGIKYGKKNEGLLFSDFQKKLKKLKQKGFILSISSKNNEKSVWSTMKNRSMILNKNDFIAPKINWGNKEDNIKQTLNELTLRAADTVFIDDNIVEIQRVKESIKDINTIHIKNPEDTKIILENDKRFLKYDVLKEDRSKYNQYKIKSKFEEHLKNTKKIDYNFFKKLNQKVIFLKCNKKNIDRTLQLFNKTNQFNFFLNRYKKNEIIKILNDQNYNITLIKFEDKFGSHGIIGTYITKRDTNNINIIDFALSCRVLNRYLEDFIILNILKKYKNKKVYIQYKKSNLNDKLIPPFLKKSFFNLYSSSKKIYRYKLSINNEIKQIKKIFKIKS